MTKKIILGIASVAILSALVPLGLADAVDGLVKAAVRILPGSDNADLRIRTTDGLPGGATGFGILTNGTLLVVTTHGGVLDSQTQNGPNDPVWHTHYVDLTTDTANCQNATHNNPTGLAVDASRITFTAPDDTTVRSISAGQDTLEIRNVPLEGYTDVNYFATIFHSNDPAGAVQEYSLGESITGVVSFDLRVPSFIDASNGIPAAVCVDNVQPVNTRAVGFSLTN